MARNRRARLRRAVTARPIDVVRPTPETAAKLRYDVIARLLREGRLAPVHGDAAEEIRTVCEAIGRGMFPTAQPASWTGRAPRTRVFRDFLDRMTAAERDLWQRRYLPWTREMAVEVAAGLPGVRWLQLVLDIVVDNCGLRAVEARYRLRHGTALDYLARGLEKYRRR